MQIYIIFDELTDAISYKKLTLFRSLKLILQEMFIFFLFCHLIPHFFNLINFLTMLGFFLFVIILSFEEPRLEIQFDKAILVKNVIVLFELLWCHDFATVFTVHTLVSRLLFRHERMDCLVVFS
jgi:prepilin signal peptidase PulO-like enzyme (type II secretory pathway)